MSGSRALVFIDFEQDSAMKSSTSADDCKPLQVALILIKGAVTDFAKAVKEHSPSEGVFRLALGEPGIRRGRSARIADPVEGNITRTLKTGQES
jgi:hypothetical protein